MVRDDTPVLLQGRPLCFSSRHRKPLRLGLLTALLPISLERHEGDVVFLLPVAPNELSQLGETLVDEVLASAAVLDNRLEPWKAEHLAGTVVRLDKAITVEQNALAGSEIGLVLLVGHIGHGA